MPDPKALQDVIGGAFESMFASGSTKYLIYVTWMVWAIVILAIGYGVYMLVMYKYKITYFEGNVEKGEGGKLLLNVRQIKRDRAMPVKEKGIPKWRLLFLWGKRIEPIDYKYIQPNNHVFLFRTGPDTFNPMPIAASNPSAVFNIDPFDRAFLNLGVQSDAREYMKDDAMKKAQIWMFVSGLIILIAVVVSGWLILKYSAYTAEKIDLVSTALKGLQGAGPR